MSAAPYDPVVEEPALRDLVHRYADAISRRDSATVAECFAADGAWTVAGYGEPRGRAEIAAFLDGLLDGWATIVHALLSGRVRVDPTDHDRATGRWYIAEFGQRADGTEVFFSGVYHDRYVREEGLWRFAHRRYDSMFRRVGADLSVSPFPADAPTFP
jgi:uncharacterized protein (TIGR02246 family)